MKPHLLWLNWQAGCAGRGADSGKSCSLQQEVFNSQHTLPRHCHGSHAWSETCVSECKLGPKQWHFDLCLEKPKIPNGDFFLEAWLLQVEHLWKLWSHKVHPLVSAAQTIEVQKAASNQTKAMGFCLSVAMLSFFPVVSIWLHSNSGHFCPSYVTDFRNGFA